PDIRVECAGLCQGARRSASGSNAKGGARPRRMGAALQPLLQRFVEELLPLSMEVRIGLAELGMIVDGDGARVFEQRGRVEHGGTEARALDEHEDVALEGAQVVDVGRVTTGETTGEISLH